jgi:hypothetical protein
VRRAAALVLLAAVLSGCGGRSGWSSSDCRREAGWLAERADSMVRHYAGQVYPADMSYLPFRDGLERFTAGRCDPEFLGRALEDRLTPAERMRFVELLPTAIAASVRRALQA